MASSTGIPARAPAHISADDDANEESGYSETSPLLGRRGDASQKDGRPIYYNLIIGTCAPGRSISAPHVLKPAAL